MPISPSLSFLREWSACPSGLTSTLLVYWVSFTNIRYGLTGRVETMDTTSFHFVYFSLSCLFFQILKELKLRARTKFYRCASNQMSVKHLSHIQTPSQRRTHPTHTHTHTRAAESSHSGESAVRCKPTHRESAATQSIECVTPGQEVVCSIPTPGTHYVLVWLGSVQCDLLSPEYDQRAMSLCGST